MKATKTQKPSKISKRDVVVAAPAGPPLWLYAVAMLAAVIAVFAVYGPALQGPFLLDDTYLPYDQAEYAVKPLSAWLKGVRPMLMFSYWLNFQQSGTETGPYHVLNVILHLLTGGLVFLIVRKVLTWAAVERARLNLLAAFAAGLFLLHPLQTESVSYVASRSEAQSVFFFLAAFTVFLYRRNTSISWLAGAMILVLFGAACLTKEHAAVLPALLLLTDYFWNPGFSWQGAKRNWKLYLPMAVAGAAALAFVWRVLSAATTAGFGMKDLTWYQYFFTECRAIWHYLLLFVFPLGQNIDHDFPVSQTVLDHGAIIGLIGLIALIGAAWYYRKRFPLICYGVFTLLLLFAPTSSVVPIRDTLVERRMYLPFIGFLFVSVGLLKYWKTSRSTLATVLGVVLLVEAGLTYQRNLLWSNAVDIWADSVSKAPTKWRPNFQLAYAYYNEQRCADAVNLFAKTAALSKPDYGLLIDWGLAADCAGNPSEAIAKLQEAAKLEQTAHVYSQIGMEYAKMAQYPQALDVLAIAAKLDPRFERTYVYRGNIYALEGNRARAVEEFQRALRLNPQDQYARDGLMKVMQR